MPSPQKQVNSSWFASRRNTTVSRALSRSVWQTENTSSCIFHMPRPLIYSHSPSTVPSFFHVPLRTHVSFKSRSLFPLCRVFIRCLVWSLPLLYSVVLEQKIASLLTDSPPSDPLFLAAVGAFTQGSGQGRRLAGAFYVESVVSGPTSAPSLHSPLLSKSPTLYSSRPPLSAKSETQRDVTVFHENVVLTESSKVSTPITRYHASTSSWSPSSLTQRDLRKEASNVQTNPHNKSRDNTSTAEGSFIPAFPTAITRRGWEGKVALEEGVADAEESNLREPFGVAIPMTSAQGKQLPTAQNDSQAQGINQELQLTFQKESSHHAEGSALTGFINEPPYNAKMGRQSSAPESRNGAVVSNPHLVFEGVETQSQTNPRIEDASSEFNGTRPIFSNASPRPHLRVAASEHSGLGNKVGLETVNAEGGRSETAISQQDITRNRSSLQQSRTKEEKKVSSIIVEFTFQPPRPYSTSFTVVPVLFASPPVTSSPTYSTYFPTSTTPQPLPSPTSYSSLPRPYAALASPFVYVPALYLIPITVEKSSTAPLQAAGISQHISLRPTIPFPEFFSRTTSSQFHKVDTSEDFFPVRYEEKKSETSTGYHLSRAASAASPPASATTAGQQPAALPPLPPVPSSLLPDDSSFSASGTPLTYKEGLQPSPVGSGEHEYSLESSTHRHRDHEALKIKTQADFINTAKRLRTPPNLSTPQGYDVKQFPLYQPFPADAGVWWTHLFQAVHSTPRQSRTPFLSHAAAAIPGSGWRRRGTADSPTTGDTAAQYFVPSTPDFATEVQDFRQARRDLPLLPEAAATSAIYGHVNGSLPRSPKVWAEDKMNRPRESFQSKARTATVSKSPPQSTAQSELKDEARMALSKILGLLAVLTGIEPASLLNFFAGTRDERPHFLSPTIRDEAVNYDRNRNVLNQLHSIKVGLRTEV